MTYFSPLKARGFTLIEAIVTIVITGILFGIVAVFLRDPINIYSDTTRRAGMVDTADFALRTMARDIRKAVPNSLRLNGTPVRFLEFVPILESGRYLSANCVSAPNWNCPTPHAPYTVKTAPLLFADAYTTANPYPGNLNMVEFTSLNRHRTRWNKEVKAAGLSLIIGNDSTNSLYQAISNDTSTRRNLLQVFYYELTQDAATRAAENVQFTSSGRPFPNTSQGNFFQIAEPPVTYQCRPNPANPEAGVLVRYENYGWQELQPQPPNSANMRTSIIATGVSACSFSMSQPQAYLSLLTLSLSISANTDGSQETITLQHQVNVDNTP